MPKLIKINPLDVQNQFREARDHRKDDHKLAAKEKFNKINNLIPNVKGRVVGRPRKSLAKSMRLYATQYLESIESVRDFNRWRKSKPGEALPWAWKMTYGDGERVSSVTAGRINVLVQILTGQQLSLPSGQDSAAAQVIVSHPTDAPPVDITPIPENP